VFLDTEFQKIPCGVSWMKLVHCTLISTKGINNCIGPSELHMAEGKAAARGNETATGEAT
jgi:hypothetical protein